MPPAPCTRAQPSRLGWVPAAGMTTNPDSAFMAQVARNLTDHVDGFLRGKRYLIVDRDSKFTVEFGHILQQARVQIVRTAFQAPNMNAIAERWVLSVKAECLDNLVLFGEGSLRRALREYGAHFHRERPHQGLHNDLIAPEQHVVSTTGTVVETERLGGLLRHYYRAA